ncbi:microcystin degradation protein MlrC [Streptosporangium becharense]|uniref:Microcystin degradation protein MlrC n=1 Tax=Streptosporangium becharense TaxID=1816182 RepID=A0A7W9MK11_9ACTN|nr:M81 family metallopeptidase [Streptosporangium becharense]MBB2910276.1 microcystin degradation protein MlrC [Streptosporangium becharense]MBB5823019.1 microcystin degradation protein MlrC [Streptosporangium becharense]
MTAASTPRPVPRIAVAGMAIESSAYSPHRAGYRDFATFSGGEAVDRYPFLAPGSELAASARWTGVFYARSIPGGRVQADVYADFRERIVEGLRREHEREPLDGILLDVHGAMSVEHMDDAEGDLVEAIRAAVGSGPLISASMDLHGNLSERFVRACELITCYRLAPHEDALETRERAARNLVHHLRTGERPVRAWSRIPILLPGEKTSTRVEPARSLYRRILPVEASEGVTDASIWIGYAWADEPRCHASVVVTGTDTATVRDAASGLAGELWAVRDAFGFVGPPGTLEQGVERALAATAKPYLISDSGDNPGAGGTGDVTWTLSRLLRMPELTADDAPVTYCASVFDAVAVDELFSAEPGSQVSVTAGARVDSRVSGPALVQGILLSRFEGDPAAGRIAVVRRGGLHVIITEFRKAFHDVADFRAIGLEPLEADIIVTKIGYLEPTLYDVAAGWTLALTPGPVDQDLERLGHQRITRPMFPFDPFDVEPDLAAVVYR